MARAHRVLLYASVATILYFLAFFQLISVPLVDPNISELLLPVVRAFSFWTVNFHAYTLSFILETVFRYWQISLPTCVARFWLPLLVVIFKIASLVASGLIWLVLAMVARLGFIYIQRLSRCIHWTPRGELLSSHGTLDVSLSPCIYHLSFQFMSRKVKLLSWFPFFHSPLDYFLINDVHEHHWLNARDLPHGTSSTWLRTLYFVFIPDAVVFSSLDLLGTSTLHWCLFFGAPSGSNIHFSGPPPSYPIPPIN